MEKINGYDEAQALTGEFETLDAGGYICIIKGAKEEMSSTNKKMLTIAFDIAEGEKAGFYQRKFDEDTRIDKKWQGTYRQMLEGEKAAGYLKGLMTSLEASNSNFKWNWDEKKLIGLKFGGIFGREEYERMDGSRGFSTKLRFVRSVEKIKNGDFKIPEDKLLFKNDSNMFDASFAAAADTDDLPF